MKVRGSRTGTKQRPGPQVPALDKSRDFLEVVQTRDVCMTMRANMIAHVDFTLTAWTELDMR